MSTSASRDAVGLVVDNRYRLVAKIGTGPSATVYLADDVRLRRRVAVKMLAESLADEPTFVGRFGAEMQSAAALRHPHIAMIHDWGVDGSPYVVGEYFAHGSLRRLLDRDVLLSPAQALQLALAASRALAYAHERGVAHRDLKPADLLFAGDGRLKITDFALARAYAEAASTQPLGVGFGAVRYAAPEQAQGRNVDGSADVYALALIVIEAVTGQVPFAADTALATLMGRVEEPPEIPSVLGAMADPLARATTVDPADRLDATDLVTALMAVADSYPEPEPLDFAGVPAAPVGAAGGTGDQPVDRVLDDITLVVAPGTTLDPAETALPGTGVGAGEVTSGTVVGRTGPPDGRVPAEPVVPSDEPSDGPADAPGASPGRAVPVAPVEAPAAEADPDEADRVRRNRRRWRIAWLVFALVVLIGGGAVGFIVFQAQRTPTHLVPGVTGVSPAQAKARLNRLGFEVTTELIRRDGTRKGEVLGSDPDTGTRLAEGKTVKLSVSAGQTLVTVPDELAGMSEDAAKTRLSGLGLEPGPSQQRYSEDIDEGQVMATDPDMGTRLEKGSSVALVVSKGPKPRVVPSVSGMSPDQARAALKAVGLVPKVSERYDTEVDKGGLIGIDPGPGATVPRGTPVDVVVSKGLLVAVPSLDGVSTVPGAIAKLQSAGLVANALGGSGSLSGRPVAFDPPAGQLVVEGSQIDIVVQ